MPVSSRLVSDITVISDRQGRPVALVDGGRALREVFV